jgi:hypothetical protein
VVIVEEFPGISGIPQVVIQVGLLLREAEPQPLRENLMMAVTKTTVGVLRP